MEGVDHRLPVLGLAGKNVRLDVSRLAFLFKQLQHLHELAENQNLLAVGNQRVEQFKERLGLAAGGVAADQRRMAADLAQPRERGQNVHLALVDALLLDHLHHLIAAAAQFGQVEFALLVAERAVEPLLDAVGQILRDVFFQAAQQQRAQLRRKPFARDALDGLGFSPPRLFPRRVSHGLRTRLVSFRELLLVAEIAGLDKIHDAPQIQQPVFQRRAGERQLVLGLQLLHRLRDLRAGIFDELRLVQNRRAEGEFLQLLQIAPQQRVIRHNQIVLRNLFPQIVPLGAAFEHEHLQVRRELLRLAPPVVQHGRRADHQ